MAWAQTPRFLDAFAATGGRGALNWRGATQGRLTRRPRRPRRPCRLPRHAGPGPGARPPATRRWSGGSPPRRGTGDMTAEYAFLARYARARTKFTMPAPSYHRRYWSAEHAARRLRLGRGVPDRDPRLPAVGRRHADLARLRLHPARRAELRLALRPRHPRRDAGRGPGPGRRAGVRRRAGQLAVRRDGRGDHRAARLPRQRPGGAWHSAGGYGAISAALFPKLAFGRLLLEYDSDRAGGFEPLADVRDGTVVVLGLLTTKSDQLESEDDVIARIDRGDRLQAARRSSRSAPSAGSRRCRSPTRSRPPCSGPSWRWWPGSRAASGPSGPPRARSSYQLAWWKAQASAMISRRSGLAGRQPSSRRAFSLDATVTAASPGRRGATLTGTGRPVTSRTASTT